MTTKANPGALEKARKRAYYAIFFWVTTSSGLLWYPLAGSYSDGTQAPAVNKLLLQLLILGFLTGGIYLLANRRLDVRPSVWLGLAVPMLFTVANPISDLLLHGSTKPLETCLSEFYTAVAEGYVCGGCLTIPLGIGYMALVRWFDEHLKAWSFTRPPEVAQNLFIACVALASYAVAEVPHLFRLGLESAKVNLSRRTAIPFPAGTRLLRSPEVSYLSGSRLDYSTWCLTSPAPVRMPETTAVKQRPSRERTVEADMFLKRIGAPIEWRRGLDSAQEVRWVRGDDNFTGIWIPVGKGHTILILNDVWLE